MDPQINPKKNLSSYQQLVLHIYQKLNEFQLITHEWNQSNSLAVSIFNFSGNNIETSNKENSTTRVMQK